MEYRQLGNTDMKVSALSFGSSALGGVFHDIDENEGIQTVFTAIDNGINLIDVSPYYGFYQAENVLGKALKDIPRDRYYLSTKVGRYGENGVKKWDYSAQKAVTSVDKSLQRLNIDYIDIINVHDVEFADLDQVIHETLPALNKLRETGKVRYVGITGLPLEKLKYVTDHADQSMIDTLLSFCHYTLFDDALLDYLPGWQQQGVGVINASPLSMGLLTEKGPADWHPASDAVKEASKKAAEYCKSKNYRIEQLAIKYAVSNKDIPTTLVSSANPGRILKNIQWVDEPLNEELLHEVQEILKPVLRETWPNS